MIGYSHLGDYTEPKDNQRDKEIMSNLTERLIQANIRDLQVTLVQKAGQDTQEITAYVREFERVIRTAKTSEFPVILAQFKAVK